MKSIKIAVCGFLCAMLAGSAMAGYGFQSFGTDTNAFSVTNFTGWKTASPQAVVTTNHHGTGGGANAILMIPIMNSVSNVPDNMVVGAKVWTDFYTIPRPFVSTLDGAPAVDPNASAQFFVDSNRLWAVIIGSGGSTETNRYDKDWKLNDVRIENDGNHWYHVSVLHDYTNKTWNLLIDGRPLAMTNWPFISSVDKYSWFSVENGGGGASNITWIDDVLITNRVPDSLTRNDDNDGMLDAWELMYFGTVTSTNTGSGDADGDGRSNEEESYLLSDGSSAGEPSQALVTETAFNSTNANIVSLDITNNTSKAMKLVINGVGSNRTYRVLASSTPNDAGFSTVIGEFDTGASESLSVVDPNALDVSQRYYRLAAQMTNGLFKLTNNLTYAFYKQSRTLQPNVYGSNFLVGIMIDYGASNTLGSTLGQQLARGLTGGLTPATADRLTVYYPSQSTFWLRDDGKWVLFSGTGSTNDSIALGHAVLIQRKNAGTLIGPSSAVFSGLMQSNTAVDVRVVSGWNLITWPYPLPPSNNAWSATLTNGLANNTDITLTDRIWVYRNGQYRVLQRRENGVWQFYPKQSSVPSNTTWGYMQFGEGVFYKNAGSVETTWRP